MKLYKPTFWGGKSLIPYLLFPLSLITSLINQVKKKSNKTKFDIKTICIGNIYLGGTGKTFLLKKNTITKLTKLNNFFKKEIL